MKWRRTLIGLWFLAAVPQALVGGTVSVKLEVVKRDASYDVGEMASFRGSVLVDGKLKTRGVAVARLSDDGMATVSVQEFDLAKDNPFTVEGTLDEPGFLQCVVSYGKGSAIAAAAFAPAHIRPATTCPDDFATFWADAIREIDQVPLDARLEPVPLFSSEHFACYKVSFATLGGSRIYGFLSVPRRGDGPFPAVVSVPGVGPGVFSPDIGCVNVPGRGMAARLRRDGGERAVSLVMNVHQYDPPRSWSALNERYNKLNASLPYYRQGVPDRDEYYYKKALLGVNRAVDWLASRPDVDPERIAAYGSRQGGAFALILAALNKHIKAVSASSPGLCDHAGHLRGRSPGWPRLVVGEGTATMRMAAYYDVVNFAPGIKCPVIASVGFVDTDCSPSSVYAAFNSVPTPKKMFNETKTANEMSFRFADYQRRWLRSQLGMDKDPLPPLATSR